MFVARYFNQVRDLKENVHLIPQVILIDRLFFNYRVRILIPQVYVDYAISTLQKLALKFFKKYKLTLTNFFKPNFA